MINSESSRHSTVEGTSLPSTSCRQSRLPGHAQPAALVFDAGPGLSDRELEFINFRAICMDQVRRATRV